MCHQWSTLMMLSKKTGPTASIERSKVNWKYAPSTPIPNLWRKTLAENGWSPTFAGFAFFTVTTVCPISWYSHHRYLNGDIPLCDLDNSSGNPVNLLPQVGFCRVFTTRKKARKTASPWAETWLKFIARSRAFQRISNITNRHVRRSTNTRNT